MGRGTGLGLAKGMLANRKQRNADELRGRAEQELDQGKLGTATGRALCEFVAAARDRYAERDDYTWVFDLFERNWKPELDQLIVETIEQTAELRGAELAPEEQDTVYWRMRNGLELAVEYAPAAAKRAPQDVWDLKAWLLQSVQSHLARGTRSARTAAEGGISMETVARLAWSLEHLDNNRVALDPELVTTVAVAKAAPGTEWEKTIEQARKIVPSLLVSALSSEFAHSAAAGIDVQEQIKLVFEHTEQLLDQIEPPDRFNPARFNMLLRSCKELLRRESSVPA